MSSRQRRRSASWTRGVQQAARIRDECTRRFVDSSTFFGEEKEEERRYCRTPLTRETLRADARRRRTWPSSPPSPSPSDAAHHSSTLPSNACTIRIVTRLRHEELRTFSPFTFNKIISVFLPLESSSKRGGGWWCSYFCPPFFTIMILTLKVLTEER